MKPSLMIVTAFLFSLVLMSGSLAVAQESEKRVKMKDLPGPVRKTVEEQSKGATLRSLAKEVENGETFYEAELKVDGHNRDVLIDPAGAVVEIEEQVALDSLPANVKATAQKAAGTRKILSVESITRNNVLEAYEIHLSQAGKTSEIKITPDGQLVTAAKKGDAKEKR